MNILIVVGARPNFMKAAPIIAAINQRNERGATSLGTGEEPAEMIRHTLVHTGQHYDHRMSASFFSDLELPQPDVYLGVGSGSHAVQTAEIMKGFEPVLVSEKPDIVLLVGDVNSTLACAMVTAKISFDGDGSRPLIVHVEAGLRSFDRTMPEEINRILTDHVADVLFVTEQSGLQNLLAEGIPADHIHFAGNTMIDSLLAFKDKAEASAMLESLGLRTRADGLDTVRRYALMTLHRPANVDRPDVFLGILSGIVELAADCPVVFPVHPRTRARIEAFALDRSVARNVILTDPLGYLDFLCMMKHATLVVTDSGGIQEETTCLGIPCVTVRENTERPVTVESGTNIVAGTDAERIKDAIRRQTGRRRGGDVPPKWDGRAAARIVETLIQIHGDRRSRGAAALQRACA